MNARLRGALVASLVVLLVLGLAFSWARLGADVADVGTCAGVSVTLPFADVPGGSLFFCAVGSAFFSGLVNGTSPTTYNPTGGVTRDQMAAFVVRTQDSAVRRASRRAAAGQWAMPRDLFLLKGTTVGQVPRVPCFDGEDIWVPSSDGEVTRVHASDGRILGRWATVPNASSAVSAAGYIYVTSQAEPGKIFRIDPVLPPSAVVEVASSLGDNPVHVAFDGLNLWTADKGTGAGLGSISRFNLVNGNQTIFGVGVSQPSGIVFDGTHLWVADFGLESLVRVNPATGGVIESIPMGAMSTELNVPVFDGANVWVPVDAGVKVVRAATPAVLLATLTGNGLGNLQRGAAFDGERVVVVAGGVNVASVWKASSLAPLGSVNFGGPNSPIGVSTDGLHFWISTFAGELVRF